MGQLKEPGLHYVEVMCEALLHGMYTVITMGVVWLLFQPRPMPTIHKVMFGAGIVTWTLSSVHLGLVIQQVTNVVVPFRNAQAQVSIATIGLLLGDMILIWRVWAVWGKNYWMTVIPVLLMLAAAGVRFAIVASIAGVLGFTSDVSSELIVANTMLCTALIAGRIWYMQWKMNRVLGRVPSAKSHNAYKGAIMLIIETGLIWSILVLLSVILDDVHSDGIHTVLDMQLPMIGMLPTLIVLFVHFDMVPGSHATRAYQSAVASQFQAAPGAQETTTIGGTTSRPTAVSLRTDTTYDDQFDLQQENNSSVRDKNPEGMV